MQFLMNVFFTKPGESSPVSVCPPVSLSGAEMHQITLALAAWNSANPGLQSGKSADFKMSHMYATARRWVKEHQ